MDLYKARTQLSSQHLQTLTIIPGKTLSQDIHAFAIRGFGLVTRRRQSIFAPLGP